MTRHGFNLHASLTIGADDDLGRERLCRYGLRPAVLRDAFAEFCAREGIDAGAVLAAAQELRVIRPK